MVRRPAANLMLAMALLGPAACIPTLRAHVTRIGPPLPPREPDAAVAVFFRTPPPWHFVEIGRVRVESTSSLERVLEVARIEAGRLGADAIIIDLRYHHSSLPVTFDAQGKPHVPPTRRLNANAIAIVRKAVDGRAWREPSPIRAARTLATSTWRPYSARLTVVPPT